MWANKASDQTLSANATDALIDFLNVKNGETNKESDQVFLTLVYLSYCIELAMTNIQRVYFQIGKR